MPLSTSSSSRSLPVILWAPTLVGAFLIFFVFILFMEIRLAQLGYHPTMLDSKEKWAKERSRVTKLGDRALILIGGSRIQLGLDLDTLRKETGLEPVQLAVDGSSFIPALKNLADDPSVRGTILVDYYPYSVAGALSNDYGPITNFISAYEKKGSGPTFVTLAQTEELLSASLHENMRSYADGATPLISLQWRLIPSQSGNYLVTLPDRSRLADYKLVPMPEFYYKRVARSLELEKSININDVNIEQILKRQVDLVEPQDNRAYLQGAKYIKRLVTKIELRGGKVLFVAMPTSGMVRDIDNKRFPDEKFLNMLPKKTGIYVINSSADPILRSFSCPDGSHLDFRDRENFTKALTHSLKIGS